MLLFVFRLETNNSYFLSQFELLVLIYFTNSFSPRELVVVTWSGVGYYQNGTDQVINLNLKKTLLGVATYSLHAPLPVIFTFFPLTG